MTSCQCHCERRPRFGGGRASQSVPRGPGGLGEKPL